MLVLNYILSHAPFMGLICRHTLVRKRKFRTFPGLCSGKLFSSFSPCKIWDVWRTEIKPTASWEFCTLCRYVGLRIHSEYTLPSRHGILRGLWCVEEVCFWKNVVCLLNVRGDTVLILLAQRFWLFSFSTLTHWRIHMKGYWPRVFRLCRIIYT
jgi:hypothetical protein